MKLIRYEHFLQDKVGEIARLAEALKLKPSKDISDKVGPNLFIFIGESLS